jgi:uncharacterized membrane protein SpoIIM required for sporulation
MVIRSSKVIAKTVDNGDVNQDRFVAERQERWAELGALLDGAGRRVERLGPDGVRRLGSLYRAAAADLGRARREYPGHPIVAQLEGLVGRARPLVYDSERRSMSFVHFVTTGYWRRVRERPALLLVSALLLFGPWMLTAFWAVRDPGAASGVVPSQYQSVTRPRHGTDLGLTPDQESAFASQIFTHNIQVTFITFAGGIAAGLGAALMLVYQGVLFGAITGLSIWAGNGKPFFQLTLAHGVLELSCIVVASAAGMRMGWALVAPGRRRRADALLAEARPAVEVVIGTMPWLVVAGLVEGFVTPSGLGLGVVLAVGLSLGALYWGLVLWRGRAERPEPSPTSDLVTEWEPVRPITIAPAPSP